jgi:anti-anti-sigma factor
VRVEIRREGSLAVAAISGEVDLASGSRLTDEVLGRLPDDAHALILDLTELRYIDSSGVRSLFEIAGTLRHRAQPLAVVVPHDSLLRSVLTMTQVDEVVPICASYEDAAAAVADGIGDDA